jgi:hypothetical protein
LPVFVNIAFGTVNQFSKYAQALFALGDNFGNNGFADSPYGLGRRVFFVINS